MAARTDFTVRMNGDERGYTSAVFKAKAANDAFNHSVGGVSKGLTAINGPLNGVAGRVTALNGLLTSGAIGFAAFGAAAAGSALAVASAVKEYDKYERGQLKVQQLLETTGYAAGLNAKQLEDQADAVALATLASVEEIQEAQGILLSFNTIQNETFSDAIMMAQDMASVFGGSAKDSAKQLGKALQDLSKQLTALSKAGVSFSESEKEMVRSMEAAGNKAEAQRYILEKLAEQVGGAGRAQAGGLSGSVDTLGQRWDELQRKWAASSGSAKAVQGWIDSLAESFRKLGEDIEPSVDGLTRKLAQLEATIVIGRNRNQKKEALANRIADVREQLMLAQAQRGDMDALNTLLENTRNNIESLEAAAANETAKPRRGRGQMGRVASNGNPELEAQKQQLKDLITLQKELDRQKEKSLETQAAVNAHQYKVGIGVTPEEAAKGLESVRKAFASQIEVERMAAESRQEMIDNAWGNQLISADRFHELTEQNWDRHQKKITDIQDREAKKRADNEKRAQKQALAAYQSTSGQFLEALETSGKQRSVLYKAAFAAQKAAAIPGMIASTEEGATAALKLGPIAGPPAATAIRAMGYTSVGLVAGQTIAGVAHGGMGYIPEESTYLLQRGEGVLSPRQNQEVQKMAMDFNAGKGGSGVVVNLIEDASRAGQVESSAGLNGEDVKNIFVSNIRNAGEVAQALEQTYGVQRQGR